MNVSLNVCLFFYTAKQKVRTSSFLYRCHPKCRSDPYNNLVEKPEGLSVDKKQITI